MRKPKRPRKKAQKSYKVRVSKDFPWQILQNIAIDLAKDFDRYGINAELEYLRLLIRQRNVAAYISACKGRWSLPSLNKMYGADLDQHISLQKIRLIRLLTIFQKYEFSGSPFDQLGNSLRIFKKYEEKCKETNQKALLLKMLDDEDDGSLDTFEAVVLYQVITHARNFIARVCGKDVDVTGIMRLARHGPGAAADRRGQSSILIEKFLPPVGTTTAAASFVQQVIESDDRWMRAFYDAGYFGPLTSIVEDGQITFVPKDAEKFRGIMLEPLGNVYLQLGVDKFLKGRLLSCWGLDLHTQEKNRELARLFSQTGTGVTVDLSGASDLIALINLLLFPDNWAQLLFDLRTPNGILPNGEKVLFEKISSMGNGYTFVLETIIFGSLLYGVVRYFGDEWKDVLGRVAVYGDDIALPEKYYPIYSVVLSKLGFVINRDKTFSTGPIRESCGHDYFRGYRIDRFTVKACPTTVPDLFTIHNSLYEIEERYGFDLTTTRLFIHARIPKEVRYFGPHCEDMDTHLFTRSACCLRSVLIKGTLTRCYKYSIVTKRSRLLPRKRRVKPEQKDGDCIAGGSKWRYSPYTVYEVGLEHLPYLPMMYLMRPISGQSPNQRDIVLCAEETIIRKGSFSLQTATTLRPMAS